MSGDSTWAKIPHDRDEWKRTVRDRWKDWLESLPERTKVLGNGSAFWTADDSLGVRMWRSGYNGVSTITLMQLHTEFEVVGEDGEPIADFMMNKPKDIYEDDLESLIVQAHNAWQHLLEEERKAEEAAFRKGGRSAVNSR